jgi:hypothetical protein
MPRAAMAADAAAIADLLAASWHDAGAAPLPRDPPRDRPSGPHRALWQDRVAAPRAGIVPLAQREDGPHGLCAARLRDDEACVGNPHLRPGGRGGGPGRALPGPSAAALRGMGARRAAPRIIGGNDGALRVHRRLGGVAAARAARLHGIEVPRRYMAWPDIATRVAACEPPR